jgi:peptide/nickel transport system permease protein
MTFQPFLNYNLSEGWYLTTSPLMTANWVAFKDVFLHLVLHALTIAAYPVGLIARMTRAAMLEVLTQDYIRTANAYGIRQWVIPIYVPKTPSARPDRYRLPSHMLNRHFLCEVIFRGLGLFTSVLERRLSGHHGLPSSACRYGC